MIGADLPRMHFSTRSSPLPALALVGFAIGLCGCRPGVPSTIAEENLRPGTTRFELHQGHDQGQVEGYGDRLSVRAGEPVRIHVQVSSRRNPKAPSFVTWDLFRLGHYQGRAAHRVTGGPPVLVWPQPDCPLERETGRVVCQWASAIELHTAGLTRGVYLVRLTRDDLADAFVPLVVRDGAAAEVVMVLPTATWQAYNNWGGAGLYVDRSRSTRFGRAVRVSYDRPFEEGGGAGQLLDRDRHLIHWLEQAGLDVAYVTDEDVDRDPGLLARAKVVLVSGHDEYWSRGVRDGMEAAVAGGTSLLLLGANAGYWQVRYEPAADGRDRRELVCFKGSAPAVDPVGPLSPELTTRFREVGRPEHRLFGAQYEEGWAYTSFPMVVEDAAHWVFSGTGLKAGDALWRLGGPEVDQAVEGDGTPSGVEVLASARFLSAVGTPTVGQMVVRQQGKALVFAAGGIDFVRALSQSEMVAPAAGRILGNLLERALGRPVPRFTAPSSLHLNTEGPPARAVALFAGTPGARGTADGPPGIGQLSAPVALAALPGGGLVVADAGAPALRLVAADGSLGTLPVALGRVLGVAASAGGTIYASALEDDAVFRIAPDGTVDRLAGAVGPDGKHLSGDHDGPGAEATFSHPAGLAITPDGAALLVTEFGNQSLRRIDLRSPAHAVTTLAKGLGTVTSVAARSDGSATVWDEAQFRLWTLPANGGPHSALVAGEGMFDGDLHHARLQAQFGLVELPGGDLAISDGGNGRVRRLTSTRLLTLAGAGHAGAANGDLAPLSAPAGLAVGRDGRLYVAESGLGTIRVITP